MLGFPNVAEITKRIWIDTIPNANTFTLDLLIEPTYVCIFLDELAYKHGFSL